jgi:hypothetical protein
LFGSAGIGLFGANCGEDGHALPFMRAFRVASDRHENLKFNANINNADKDMAIISSNTVAFTDFT